MVVVDPFVQSLLVAEESLEHGWTRHKDLRSGMLPQRRESTKRLLGAGSTSLP